MSEPSGFGTISAEVDVAIVGAGLSGIGMAAHLQRKCPSLSFALFERRAALGGTWDLFRYPGIRSDSDMHTLGFEFEPWTHERSIAGGEAILDYLNRTADKRGIRRHIRFGTKVVAADWDGRIARWRMAVELGDGKHQTVLARFLYLGAGYYDYDRPHDAAIPGTDRFQGTLIHPQFWPTDFEHSGKRIVVIGSGATAVTIVPAMAGSAAHVTMLQRTPTWYAIRPSKDALANTLRKYLPDWLAYRVTRFRNTRFQDWIFKRMRSDADAAKQTLTRHIQSRLGEHYCAENFTPPYDPWDQRLCMVPDGDMFEAIKAGDASIVTDAIATIDETGIQLKSGRRLEADAIVTATGLKLATGGKIAISVDGRPVEFSKHFYYKSCMLSNVPNLAMAFGYFNASWTLRVDLSADYVCKLMRAIDDRGADCATPVLTPGEEPYAGNIFEMTSGYLQRDMHLLPKSASTPPWWLGQNYLFDRTWMKKSPIDDGIIHWGRASNNLEREPVSD